MIKNIIYFSIIILSTIFILMNAECSDSTFSIPKFYLMEKCHRSKLGVAVKANMSSLKSCEKFAIEKKGLAINFSPKQAAEMSQEPLDYTCEVLKCAETEDGVSLANDTRYDYYSLYAKPLPHVNSTCIPATGMFHLLTTPLNYTQAVEQCRNMSAVLTDVSSEQRTDALSQVLTGANVNAALVGFRRMNNTDFTSVNGDSMDCNTYRAWAPGHPKHDFKKFDCVVITRQRTWVTIGCKKKMPALCELVPGGPYKIRSLFASRKRNGTIESNNNQQ